MNPMKVCSVRLNDGHLMPVLGFSTSAPREVVKTTLKMESSRHGSLSESEFRKCRRALFSPFVSCFSPG